MFRSCRIERTTPSTQPPKCSWISRDSQPSVAPPRASPTAAPARQPTARLTSWCPLTERSPSDGGLRPAGGKADRTRADRSTADRIPAVRELLDQVVEADLIREVLPERGRRHLRLPARVRHQ